MRITEIDQREWSFFNDGLAPLHLKGLRRIVVLAGPNGAGKTRVLQRIARLHNQYTDGAGNNDTLKSIPQGQREQFLNGSSHLGGYLHSGELRQMETSRDTLGVFVDRAGLLEGPYYKFSTVPYVTRDIALSTPSNMAPDKLREKGEGARHPGLGHLSESALPYLQMLQDRWWEATHPEADVAAAERQEATASYQDLKELIRVVLGTPVSRTLNGEITLFRLAARQARLSQGQCMLLMWAVGLHAQGTHLRDTILVMDEPENHLHPDVMLGTIQRIATANAAGQMWIATHSVPLIAYLFQHVVDDLSLVYMSDGVASYAGSDPERVVESLMGGGDNVVALRAFIDVPDKLAIARFAAESLLPPQVVADSGTADPQVRIAATSLFGRRATSRWPFSTTGPGQAGCWTASPPTSRTFGG